MSIKRALTFSAIGYVFIIISVLFLYLAIRLFTGFFPSFNFFFLSLISFRLHEINIVLLLSPLFASFMFYFLFSNCSDKRIAGGLSLSLYYFLVVIVFYLTGTGEFSLSISVPWMLWVFVLGYVSEIINIKYNKKMK